MRNILKVTSVALLASISQLVYSAPITDTYTTGDTLTATTLGNIKSAVNDNDSRVTTNATGITTNATGITTNTGNITTNATGITTIDTRISAIEGAGQNIAIDCATDNTALLNTTLAPGNTYVLTGMCNGPILISQPAGTYRFQGDASGSKDDGIILPVGLTNDYAVSAYGPVAVTFDNLTISGANYTLNTDHFVYTLDISSGSAVSISNVDIVGGDYGVNVNNADLEISSGVTITGFRELGLAARNGGFINSGSGPLTVTGAPAPLAGPESGAIAAFKGAIIIIEVGGTFTPGTNDGTNPDFENYAAGAWDNGTIRVTSGGTSTFNGIVVSSRSSAIRFKSGVINGGISVYNNSNIQLNNVTQSGGEIDLSTNSTLGINPGTTISNNASDDIQVSRSSVLFFDEGVVGNNSGAETILVESGSVMETLGNVSTNLNSRNVTCTNNSTYIQGNATMVGTVIGC